MDMSDYIKEFISEAEDFLNDLNDDLLTLEDEPENSDVINKAFRAFHTLKGNSATMGFEKYSHLAHDLESLLDKIRNKQIAVDGDVMDVLFNGLDRLEVGLELIKEKNNDEDFSIEENLMAISKLMKSESEKSPSVKHHSADSKLIEDIEKKSNGKEILRFRISFSKENPLRGVKAVLVLKNLKLAPVEILGCSPSEDEIKAKKFKEYFEVFLTSDLSKEEILNVIDKVSDIEKIESLDFSELKNADNKTNEKPNSKENPKEVKKDNIAKRSSNVVKKISSVKIDIKHLDTLMNLIGELLISNLRLQQLVKGRKEKNLEQIMSQVDRLINSIQDEVMRQRMIPIGNIFNRFPRMVRDLAKQEEKKIKFEIEGEGIEFDRTVLDEIGDPIVHILRNSVDHGIETPEERKKMGKPEDGTIKLTARRDKSSAIIEILDDGYGIDPKKVKESSIKKGLVTRDQANKMTDNELQMLIFRPGVSTNEVVTEVSGRGVGMDVVLTKIKNLGGHVELDSSPGKGTKVTLKLPLTVAIVASLMVKVNDSTYAVPLRNVETIVTVEKKNIKTISGKEVFILRGEDIPIFHLRQSLFGLEDVEGPQEIVVVDTNDSKIGIVVDEVVGQQQILIKNLGKFLKDTKGFSGACIMGDGSVALILDVENFSTFFN